MSAVLLFVGCGTPTTPSPDNTYGDTTPCSEPCDVDLLDTSTTKGLSVDSSGILSCANPGAREQATFDLQYADASTSPEGGHLQGGGLMVADFANTDRPQIITLGTDQAFLIQSDGMDWETVPQTGFADGIDVSNAVGGSVVDYDGDGDLDLFITRWSMPNVLLANDGTGMFTDVTTVAGLGETWWRSVSSSWADMDGDEDLDLVVGSYGPDPIDIYSTDSAPGDPSEMYENLGDGTFANRSNLLPSEIHDAHVFMTAWQDLNGDGFPELLSIHDFGWLRQSVLLWNRGGTLELDDGTAGFHPGFAGMGIGIGDLNRDLIPDFIQTSWLAISLLLSHSTTDATDGTLWIEHSDVKGLNIAGDHAHEFGWGAELADADNDGKLDAILMFGHWDTWPSQIKDQPDAFFRQQSDGTFVDVADEWNINDDGMGRAVVVTDIDNNGWLDLVKRQLDGNTLLYYARCSQSAWLRFRLRANGPNTFGIGAVIQITDGEDQWIRWLNAGSTGLMTGTPPEAHFGLGKRDTVEHIKITWPDGEVHELTNIATRQLLTVDRR